MTSVDPIWLRSEKQIFFVSLYLTQVFKLPVSTHQRALDSTLLTSCVALFFEMGGW